MPVSRSLSKRTLPRHSLASSLFAHEFEPGSRSSPLPSQLKKPKYCDANLFGSDEYCSRSFWPVGAGSVYCERAASRKSVSAAPAASLAASCSRGSVAASSAATPSVYRATADCAARASS